MFTSCLFDSWNCNYAKVLYKNAVCFNQKYEYRYGSRTYLQCIVSLKFKYLYNKQLVALIILIPIYLEIRRPRRGSLEWTWIDIGDPGVSKGLASISGIISALQSAGTKTRVLGQKANLLVECGLLIDNTVYVRLLVNAIVSTLHQSLNKMRIPKHLI